MPAIPTTELPFSGADRGEGFRAVSAFTLYPLSVTQIIDSDGGGQGVNKQNGL